MTESSPVACANPPESNIPASVGKPIPGVQVKLGENDALLIKGPNVMLGYWDNPEATRQVISEDGWLNSGDRARIDKSGHVFITGRLKEIIVMSNGEKIPPLDVENAIMQDSLFEQVILLGEGKPYLSVITVLNNEQWKKAAAAAGCSPDASGVASREGHAVVLERVCARLKSFPGYAQVRRVYATLDPWTVDNGMMTPTLKLKRARIMEKFDAEIDKMYAGH
jgi:long-chain acyl-CoA synthetase